MNLHWSVLSHQMIWLSQLEMELNSTKSDWLKKKVSICVDDFCRVIDLTGTQMPDIAPK